GLGAFTARDAAVEVRDSRAGGGPAWVGGGDGGLVAGAVAARHGRRGGDRAPGQPKPGATRTGAGRGDPVPLSRGCPRISGRRAPGGRDADGDPEPRRGGPELPA